MKRRVNLLELKWYKKIYDSIVSFSLSTKEIHGIKSKKKTEEIFETKKKIPLITLNDIERPFITLNMPSHLTNRTIYWEMF